MKGLQKQQSMPLGCMFGDLDDNHWILKLGFKNVFNSLCSDKILLAVCELALALYPLPTLPIPHPPHCFGMTAYFSLQREYNREIRWVPSLLSVHTQPVCPVEVRVQCMVTG